MGVWPQYFAKTVEVISKRLNHRPPFALFAASRELMAEDSNMASRALTRCPRSPVPWCCQSRFRSLCEAALVDFRCRNERSTGLHVRFCRRLHICDEVACEENSGKQKYFAKSVRLLAIHVTHQSRLYPSDEGGFEALAACPWT